MKIVANKPKLNASTKAQLRSEAESVMPLSLVYQGWLSDQRESVETHRWSGNISPSSKLTFSECFEDYFVRVDEPLDFSPATLCSVNMGIALHKAFEAEFDRHVPNYCQMPRFKTRALRNWFLDIRPELPVHHIPSGIRGKIDRWPEINGRPVIYDLKTKFMQPKQWQQVRNVTDIDVSHFMQLALYFFAVVKGEYFDVEPRHVAVGYWNVPTLPCLAPPSRREIMKPITKEIWKKICAWVAAVTICRNQKLSGKRVVCTNPFCHKPEHKSRNRGRVA